MKIIPRFSAVLGLILLPALLFAQQTSNSQTENAPSKFALVIGNGMYTNLAHLANPVNDANDMADTLQSLGFTVDRLIDASLDQMDSAVMRLKNRLSVSKNTYGFFFYAGHGVQSNGENYLIPVDASIPGENFLRSRSLSVQATLDELNDAGNSLNVVVLDACRDNPFGWARGGNRGLVVVDNQPTDSIIVFATSAGQTAKDGSGRNGLFTSQLLPYLKTPGMEISEIFRRTMGDVMRVSGNSQRPAIYNQFPGQAWFSPPPPVAAPAPAPVTPPVLPPAPAALAPAQAAPPAPPPAPASQPIAAQTAAPAAAPAAEPAAAREAPPAIAAKPAPLPPPAPKPVAPPKAPKTAAELQASRLNTIGASVGSAFSAPWLIGTLEGTYAPTNYSFFDLGIDLGTLSGEADVGHFSVYPFARYAFFAPFATACGWYAGAGAGFLYTSYNFPGADMISANYFLADITTGFIFYGFTVSYSLATNFTYASNKVAFGYSYRF